MVQGSIVLNTSAATTRNIEQGNTTDWTLYDFICEHPNLSMYELHKELGWSVGKVQKAIERLRERGYVESRTINNPSRHKMIIAPTDWKKIYQMLREEGFEE
jgi:DNA-binding MarR family transcriptional regulator